jgi:hypothetical protein
VLYQGFDPQLLILKLNFRLILLEHLLVNLSSYLSHDGLCIDCLSVRFTDALFGFRDLGLNPSNSLFSVFDILLCQCLVLDSIVQVVLNLSLLNIELILLFSVEFLDLSWSLFQCFLTQK